MHLVDLTGQRFGHQVVLGRGPSRGNGIACWWTQCDCGSDPRLVVGQSLRRGHSKSCGCGFTEYSSGRPPLDRTGEIWGEWTILGRAERPGRVTVRCSCGFEADRQYASLKVGASRSCGHTFGWNQMLISRAEGKPSPEGHKQDSRERRREKAVFVENYKMDRGCLDCGLRPPYSIMLSYDHLPQYGKEFNLSKASSYGWDRIHAEIAKCEIVCLNCHAIRTAERLLQAA